MTSIPRIAQDNLGGNLTNIYIVAAKGGPNVQVAAGRVTNNLLLSAWEFIDFTFDSVSFSEDPVSVGGDTAFRKFIVGFIPKDRIEVSTALLGFHKARVLVVVTDRNGTRRVIGTKKRPAVLLFEMNTGPKMSDANRYKVTITQTDKDQAPFYDIE